MALVGVELETLVFEPDAQTTRPPPCASALEITLLSEMLGQMMPPNAQHKLAPVERNGKKQLLSKLISKTKK